MKKALAVFISSWAILFFACKETTGHKDSAGLTEIKVMLSWDPGPENAFLYFGVDQGIFKKNGLRLKIIPSRGSSIVSTALISRAADFGFLSSDYLLTTRTKNPTIKAVLVLYHQTPVTIYSLEESNIKEPKDLNGKRLGVLTYSAAYPQVINFLKLYGISFKEVPSINSVSELIAKQIDAAMNYTNYDPVLMTIKEKRPVNEILLRDYEIFQLYGTSISTDEGILNTKADLAEKFVHAVLESLEQARNNHEGALDSLLKAEPGLRRDVEDGELRKTEEMIYSPETKTEGLGYMNLEGWKKSIDTLINLKALNIEINPSSVFDDRFIRSFRTIKK